MRDEGEATVGDAKENMTIFDQVERHLSETEAPFDVEAGLSRLRQQLAQDRPQQPAMWVPSTSTASRLRRAVAFLSTAVGAAGYGVLATLFASSVYILLFLFVLVPTFLVLVWYLRARDPEVARPSALLDSRAQELRQVHHRLLVVTRTVVAQRRLCEDYGLKTAASKLDFLRNQLRDARKSTRTLAKHVAEGSEATRRFAQACERDPYRACSEYDQLPPIINPIRIGAEVDDLVRVLRLATDVAADIPVRIGIEGNEVGISIDAMGEIASELEGIFREVLNSGRFLMTEYRRTVRAFDTLHRLVTTMLIKKLARDPASRATARAAVVASRHHAGLS
jgi:hypothetical protein